MIDIFSNTLGEEELAAVERVLASHWLGRGEECSLFEQELAEYLDVNHVMLFNSCTSAIFVGLRALGIGPGDEVIISTVNFVACASAVVELGATPVFADVNPCTLNIEPSEIGRLRNVNTKAVILLHYGGHPSPMEEIRRETTKLYLIEDSANSIASLYDDESCGIFGDMGVWSFDAMKELVMGDGGALYLLDPLAAERADSYRYLGLAPKVSSGMDSLREKKTRWWEYDVGATSGRYLSNDILAAMGRVQLCKLSGFIRRRKAIWERYQAELVTVNGSLRIPPEPLPGCESSYYLYWIQAARRDELARHLVDNGVYCTFRYFPLHLVKFFGADCKLPNAEYVNEVTLNLPLHQNLTDADVSKIISLVRGFYD